MKILHVFSDWKWTGPAEPVLSLCKNLLKKGVDVTVSFRLPPPDYEERTVATEAKKRDLVVYDGFRLNRYFTPEDWLYDLKAMGEYIKKNRVDIVHSHLSHDHFASLAALLFMKRRPLIIRSDHKRDGMPTNLFMKWAVSHTDGLVGFSRKIIEQDIKAFGFPREQTSILPPGIEPYNGPVQDLRGEFGLAETEKVLGVIGRLKPDRGFDVILKAFKIIRDRVGGAKLIIVGRSSQIEKSVIEPLEAMGLQDDVILAGYRVEDYFSVIDLFDIFLMMRAGSDGSARALREVMIQGKPAIVSDLGILPELVENGVSGYSVSLNENELAEKIETLLRDDAKRKSFGIKAREIALTEWDYGVQAEQMIQFYKKLMDLRRG